jgi:hypothetical protein
MHWQIFKFFFFTGCTAPLGPGLLFFSFMIILQTVELLGRVISSSQGLYLNTGQHKHRINTYTYQTSIPWVGFEPTILASERAKVVHVLDRSATVTALFEVYSNITRSLSPSAISLTILISSYHKTRWWVYGMQVTVSTLPTGGNAELSIFVSLILSYLDWERCMILAWTSSTFLG